MKFILVLVCFFSLISSNHLSSQELYSIHPINDKRYHEKNGLYFPEHNIKIENGSEVIIDAKPVFKLKLSGYFQYIYELFEDTNKVKYLIISAVPDREVIVGYASLSSVKRGLFYVIPISNSSLVYYGDMNNSTLNKKKETEYYSFGNFIHYINIEESILQLKSVKDKEEKIVEIELFEY